MGRTKKAITDQDFYTRMLRNCANEEEKGLITILDITGMRVSGLCGLTRDSLVNEEGTPRLHWRDPQTGQRYRTEVDGRKMYNVERFLEARRKTRRHYYNLVRVIASRAGFPDVSPMTFYHNGGRGHTLVIRDTAPPKPSRTPFEQFLRANHLTRKQAYENAERARG